eukprot:COSAG05_NODE_5097_length_1264_cov_1.104721_1_plen_190_part_00
MRGCCTYRYAPAHRSARRRGGGRPGGASPARPGSGRQWQWQWAADLPAQRRPATATRYRTALVRRMSLNPGWTEDQIPSQVPASLLPSLGKGGDGPNLNPGWTADRIPSQCPKSVRDAVIGDRSCDILIKGGTVVDGTGGEPYVADVAIREGQISAIGPDLDLKSGRVVDAAGHIVTPGWVDVHTHYDG